MNKIFYFLMCMFFIISCNNINNKTDVKYTPHWKSEYVDNIELKGKYHSYFNQDWFIAFHDMDSFILLHSDDKFKFNSGSILDNIKNESIDIKCFIGLYNNDKLLVKRIIYGQSCYPFNDITFNMSTLEYNIIKTHLTYIGNIKILIENNNNNFYINVPQNPNM